MRAQSPHTRNAALVSAGLAVVVWALFSNEYCCAAVWAPIVAGAAVWFAGAAMDALISGWRWRDATLWSLAVLLPALMLVTPMMHLSPAGAFHVAFGSDAPPDVRFAWAQRSYAGGSGDFELVVAFRANSETVRELLAAHQLVLDEVTLEKWRGAGAGWGQLPELALWNWPIAAQLGARWNDFGPMVSPQVYRPRGRSGLLTVLVDAQSDRVIVFKSRG